MGAENSCGVCGGILGNEMAVIGAADIGRAGGRAI